MGLIFLMSLCLLFPMSASETMGVTYGHLGNNLPSPSKSVELIKSLKAGRVKLNDADPKILKALGNTNIPVTVTFPNELITPIASNQTLADEWIRSNVAPYYPQTLIQHVLVGYEVLSQPDTVTWYNLVPAMRKIRKSLVSYKLNKIKVGTPLALDCLNAIYPPSNASFRPSIAGPVVKPLLQFINRTKSFFFVNIKPYDAWVADPVNINLNYALLELDGGGFKDMPVNLWYTTLFEQMLDSLQFAIKDAGYAFTRTFISETGWPNEGDIDQIGANIYNAAVYNYNVIKLLAQIRLTGTPFRAYTTLPSFISALYNENQKPGPGTERHFGLLYPNGTNIYPIDLSGKTVESHEGLPKSTKNKPYKGNIWCVAESGANTTALLEAQSLACGQGNGTCDPIKRGGKCFEPDSVWSHASYAFSSYWAQFRKSGATCYLSGLAVQTTQNPSFGSCKFPSVTL